MEPFCILLQNEALQPLSPVALCPCLFYSMHPTVLSFYVSAPSPARFITDVPGPPLECPPCLGHSLVLQDAHFLFIERSSV